MDIGAFVQIPDLDHILSDNGIEIPRLRGLRWMGAETPHTDEDITNRTHHIWMYWCGDICSTRFKAGIFPDWSEYSQETRWIREKYLLYDKKDDCFAADVNWKVTHGKRRKMFKFAYKKVKQKVLKQAQIFDKYCGRPDVLYVHARIGGNNWDWYDGPEIAKQPWFLERVDDAFDSTYCDIYVKVKIDVAQTQDGGQTESEVYCDRNLCAQNEYNGIECDECQEMRKE